LYTIRTTVLFVVLCIFGFSLRSSGSYPDESDNDTESGSTGWTSLYPFRSISFGLIQYETSYPVNRYTFPYTDGTFALNGINFYISVLGEGNVLPFLGFQYDIRANNVEGIRFKKGSVILTSHNISLEVGRNNLWLGHSSYSPLLLSNNAEPYTLVQVRSVRPVKIRYVGGLSYALFHGWPRNFNVLGHRITWHPSSWLEFSVNQTVAYDDRYTLLQYLQLLTAQEANVRGRLGRADTRASIESALSLDFIHKFVPMVKTGKLYFEYGGEDLYAYWQKDDDLWVGPFGFEFLEKGYGGGIHLATETEVFRFEYAQNYKNHYLFYDPYDGARDYSWVWYRHNVQEPFQNGGAVMGHQMGSTAENYVGSISKELGDLSVSFMYNRRLRYKVRYVNDFAFKDGDPEILNRFVLEGSYRFDELSISAFLIYNRYHNVDINPDILLTDPVSGRAAREFLAGIRITYSMF
jgi:hypothetical protein